MASAGAAAAVACCAGAATPGDDRTQLHPSTPAANVRYSPKSLRMVRSPVEKVFRNGRTQSANSRPIRSADHRTPLAGPELRKTLPKTKRVTTHVSSWIRRDASPPASGVSPIWPKRVDATKLNIQSPPRRNGIQARSTMKHTREMAGLQCAATANDNRLIKARIARR